MFNYVASQSPCIASIQCISRSFANAIICVLINLSDNISGFVVFQHPMMTPKSTMMRRCQSPCVKYYQQQRAQSNAVSSTGQQSSVSRSLGDVTITHEKCFTSFCPSRDTASRDWDRLSCDIQATRRRRSRDIELRSGLFLPTSGGVMYHGSTVAARSADRARRGRNQLIGGHRTDS